MDFENMKVECPWIDERNPTNHKCDASRISCRAGTCAPFHFVKQITKQLYVSVAAEIKENK